VAQETTKRGGPGGEHQQGASSDGDAEDVSIYEDARSTCDLRDGKSPIFMERKGGSPVVNAFLACIKNDEGRKGCSPSKPGVTAWKGGDVMVRSLFPAMWARGYGNVGTGLAALGWRGDITTLEGWGDVCLEHGIRQRHRQSSCQQCYQQQRTLQISIKAYLPFFQFFSIFEFF
jgi:hypothetical protein